MDSIEFVGSECEGSGKGIKRKKRSTRKEQQQHKHTRNRLFMCMIASDFVTFSVKCHHLNIKAVHMYQRLVGESERRRERNKKKETEREDEKLKRQQNSKRFLRS